MTGLVEPRESVKARPLPGPPRLRVVRDRPAAAGADDRPPPASGDDRPPPASGEHGPPPASGDDRLAPGRDADQPASASWDEPPARGRGEDPPSLARGAPRATIRRGLVAAALSAVEDWLLQPAVAADDAAPPAPPRPRPVVAVFGLARGCGATVVARALAVELAERDPDGAAAVSCDERLMGVPLASAGAARLARVLADLPGAATRAVGRLCLVGGTEPLGLSDTARHHAPLVIDAGSAAIGGVPASVADHVVLVASPRLEPALAAVAARCVERVGPEPLVVVTRARGEAVEGAGWLSHAAVAVPDSRVGARLALAGREPRGGIGRAASLLADLCAR